MVKVVFIDEEVIDCVEQKEERRSCPKGFEKAKFLAPIRRRQKKTIEKGHKTVRCFLNLANILFTVVEAFIAACIK